VEEIFNGEPKIIKKYKCFICTNVVNEPSQCGECESIFCEGCINIHLEKYNDCPNCRDDPFKKGKLSKFIKLQLEELEFKCPFNCGELFGYYDTEKHRVSCKNIEDEFKCNLCEKNLVKDENLEENHKLECEILKIKCDFCLQELNKYDYKQHLESCENYSFNCNECKINYNRINKESHDHLCEEIKKYMSQISSLIGKIRDL